MASVYPDGLDTLAADKTDDTSQGPGDHADHHNDLADAVNKIEGELGIAPSGASTTVKARIDGVETTAGAALPKAGGTMTGKIVLDGDPTASLHPATRQYVLAQIAALIAGAPGALDTLNEIAAQLSTDESAVSALTATVAGKLSAANNLSDLVNAVTARTNLGLGSAATHPSTDFDSAGAAAAAQAASQPLDTDLTAIAALSTTAFGRSLLALADAAAGRSLLDAAQTAHTHAEADVTGLTTDLAAKAPLASPTFTGDPKAPTPAGGDNDTSIATTAYVQTEIGVFVPKSLVDAKGDLLVGSADNVVVRKAVGSDGQVLTADAASAGGVKWASAAPSGVAPLTGQYLRPFCSSVANTSVSTGVQSFVPIVVPVTQTFDRISVVLSTLAGTTGTVRLGIYLPDANGWPSGSPLLDAGTVDTTTGAVALAKEITISQQLTPGLYWLSAQSESTGTTPGFKCAANNDSAAIWPLSLLGALNTGQGFPRQSHTGALASVTPGSLVLQTGPIIVYLRAA